MGGIIVTVLLVIFVGNVLWAAIFNNEQKDDSDPAWKGGIGENDNHQ
jgi:hypothetical protein